VPLRLARAQALTGAPLSAASVEDALARLGCAATADGDGRWLVTPPSARADLTREVDVIEDVLRVVGYGSVPATLPALSAAPHALVRATADRVRHALAGAGLAEAITFGFQAAARIEHLGLPADDRRAQPIAVRNPMSIDQAVMRTSLLPNLIAAIARNHSFGVTDVALFEVGAVFLRAAGQPPTGEPTALADEPTQAAVVLAGSRPRRFAAPEPWDVFDAKGYALAALAALGVRDVAVTAAEDIPYLHPGVAARILHRGIAIGCVGELHPDVRARFGVEVPVLVAELDLSLVDVPGPVHMRPVPRFPGLGAGRVAALARGGAGRRRRAGDRRGPRALDRAGGPGRGVPRRRQAGRRQEEPALVDHLPGAGPDPHRGRDRRGPRGDRRPPHRGPARGAAVIPPAGAKSW
jgi:phenylalanyl-tRNA synthetase beta chain